MTPTRSLPRLWFALLLVCLSGLAAMLAIWPALDSAQAAIAQQVLPRDWMTLGWQTGAEYGISVAGAGDVNGDGYADLLIGSDRYVMDGLRLGGVFVYYGARSNIHTAADWSQYGPHNGSLFGFSVSSAGDVNHDGYDDVLIGAYHVTNPEASEGAAYLYLGSKDGLADTPVWSYEGNVKDAMLGYAVSGIGDVNGDHYDDVAIGVPGHSQDEAFAGLVLVFLGQADGLAGSPAWSFSFPQAGAQLGKAISPAGDVNNDGFADLLIAAPTYDNLNGDDAGRVYLFTGSAMGLCSQPVWIADGASAGGWFGKALAGGGDLNHDGYSDIAIGAPLAANVHETTGLVQVFLGSNSGLVAQPALTAALDQGNTQFGAAVDLSGDFNNDGFDDLAIGAPNYEDDQNLEGGVFIYAGGAWINPTPGWEAQGDKAETSFGQSLALAGDINGDGYGDLLVGAPTYKHDDKTLMGMSAFYLGGDASISNYRVMLPAVWR